MSFIRKFLEGPNGAKKILNISFPLILSTSSFTIMQFVDRKFLASYSLEAFEAASPAGMTSFMFLSLFFGTIAYANTFVAQYSGAGRLERVGSSVWQGLYLAFISWIIYAPLAIIAKPIFILIGHQPEVMLLEIEYFQILVLGSIFVLINLALTCFYSGRGKTKVVMFIRFAAMFLNIPLDYCMIFGKCGFPEMGITGAAIATVISTAFSTFLFLILIFSKDNRDKFATLRNWRFDGLLFKRLLKYGLPSGVQFVVDIFAFTIFLLMVGRLGKVELAATNAAWSLNMLVFMPMIGFSIALSTIVGNAVGRSEIHSAHRATSNTFFMVLAYMGTIALLFIIIPRSILGLLLGGSEDPRLNQVIESAVVYLRFVAFYSLFDAIVIVFSSAIKGAGDTKYVMWVAIFLSTIIIIFPSIMFCVIWVQPAEVSWSFLSGYILIISIVIYRRYRSGKWKQMRVIESTI